MRKQLLFALFVLLLTATLVTAVTFASSNESPVVALDNSDLDPVKLANGTQECPLCGKPAEQMQNRMFELADGYLFCASCDSFEEDGFSRKVPVSPACFAAMKHLLVSPVNKIFLFRLEENALAELSALTEEYLLLRVERKLKTLDFLKKNL